MSIIRNCTTHLNCTRQYGPFLVQSRTKFYVNKKRKNARKKRQKRKLRLQRYRQHQRMGSVLKPTSYNQATFFSRPDNEANPFNIPDIFDQVSVVPPYQLLYSEPKEMKELPDQFFGGELLDELPPRGRPENLEELSSKSSLPSEISPLTDGMDMDGDWEGFVRQELEDDDGQFNMEKFAGLFDDEGQSKMNERPQSDYEEDYASFLDEANMNDENLSNDETINSTFNENKDIDDDPYDFDSLFAQFEKEEENIFDDKS